MKLAGGRNEFFNGETILAKKGQVSKRVSLEKVLKL